jgi:predicted  nucleic acid-binding Zn-ribbon protein
VVVVVVVAVAVAVAALMRWASPTPAIRESQYRDRVSTFDALLTLQAADTRIDQLRHRLANLPERAAVQANDEAIAALERSTAQVQARRDDLAREQKRVDDELAGVEDKIAHVNDQLYGHGLTSPKEAQALQDELTNLSRRRSDVEDRVLALLEEADPLDADLDERGAEQARLDGAAASLIAALAEAEASTQAELDAIEAERRAPLAELPADLLATYEQLRSQHGGIAVARLQGGACGGCHLQLSAAEADRLRRLPDDELGTCEECGRLLVH